MSTTPNFGIVMPEGTDTFAPLTFDNNAYTLIDSVMKANQDRGITTASCVVSGGIVTLTRAITSCAFFVFTATADFDPLETVAVDGVTVSVRYADGTVPEAGAWVINQSVLCYLNGTILNVISTSAKGVSAGTIGALSDLETTDKSSIVAAINEVAEDVADLEAQKEVINGTTLESNVPAATFTNVSKLNLSAGTWLLFGSCTFASSTECVLSFAENSIGSLIGRSRAFSATLREISLSGSRVITLNTASEIELRVESAVATNVTHSLTAVRYM